MAAVTANTSAHDIPDDDELEAILNGTLDGQDIFDVSNLARETQDIQPSRPTKQAGDDSGLGIDEEIKVVKKRTPIPKLDDNRLLSDPGIPKLRRISKERLKFKGKGHEYGDIARMLNMYQFWLDELYPRAKFADGLAMIEKLGHTKRVQMMRRQWINEGKPNHHAREDDELEVIGADEAAQEEDTPMDGVQREVVQSVEEGAQQDNPSEVAEQPTALEEPEEDELDALLAEGPTYAQSPKAAAKKTVAEEDDPYADAMEAMAEMDDMW